MTVRDTKDLASDLSIAEKMRLQTQYDAGKPFCEAIVAAAIQEDRTLIAKSIWRQWREDDPNAVR